VFYTLSMWAIWMVAAALIGGVVAWLVRGLRMPRGRRSDSGSAEVALLRARVNDLQMIAAERDRLRLELEQRPPGAPADDAESLATVQLERDLAASQLAESHQWMAELRVRLWNSEAMVRDLQSVIRANAVTGAPPKPDLVEGSRVMGVPVVNNDFTLIEGVGPRIAQLLVDKGITTWWALANSDVELLRSVLREAGPKFQVHDPRSWPQQARLLAFGEWEKFLTLAAALRYGHPSR
jgi:predicted flap endonuclease-1-like 5' DNA nuclease